MALPTHLPVLLKSGCPAERQVSREWLALPQPSQCAPTEATEGAVKELSVVRAFLLDPESVPSPRLWVRWLLLKESCCHSVITASAAVTNLSTVGARW